MNPKDWLDRVSGGESLTAIAKRINKAPSTLIRQVERGKITAETCIHIARQYGVHPADGLAALDYFTDEEASRIAGGSLSRMSNEDILREVYRRIDPDSVVLFQSGISPLAHDVYAEDEATITPLFDASEDFDHIPEHAVADSSADDPDGIDEHP